MAFQWDVTNPNRPIAEKDPNAVIDYPIDFSEFLRDLNDSYDSHTVIINGGGIVAGLASQELGVIKQFISGGTVGEVASFTVRMVTIGGRTEDKTFYLRIKDK